MRLDQGGSRTTVTGWHYKMISRIFYICSCMLLFTGCTSAPQSQRVVCEDYDISELSGVFENQGTKELKNRALRLTQVLWINDESVTDELHDSIDTVEIKLSRDGVIDVSGYSGTRLIKAKQAASGISLDGNKIKVFSKFGILPDPSGGLLVGPQSMEITLSLNCNNNLEFHKHESATGLLLAFIPVSGSTDFYSEFKRVTK
ncbi:MAG: hypothetical protein ABW080_17845 [Candidatus Thiodiazotropha sp.]